MLTGCGAWTVQVDLEALAAQVQFADHPAGAVVPPAALSVRSGWIWSTITVDAQQAQVRTTLKGLPREQARSLDTVLQRARHLTTLRRVVDDAHGQILAWAQAVQQQAGQWAGRWWSRELVADWVRSRPSLDGEFEQARQVRELQVYLRAQPAAVQQAMAWWDADLGQAQLSGVRDEVRPPVIFVGQAAVVIAGVVLVSSFASDPLAVWERARTSMPR